MTTNTVKHTPGQWLFDRNEGWVYTRIAPLTKFVVATMESGTQDEQEANACLIAAAPDLLDACDFALTILEALGNGRGDAANACRTAISKATGSPAPQEKGGK